MFSDLRFAFRQLIKFPAFSAVAIFTVMLGIGACAALFSVVDSVLLRPLAYPDSGRLVVVNETKLPQFPTYSVAPANYFDWLEQAKSFDSLAMAQFGIYTLTGMGDPAVVFVKSITPNYLSTLRVHPQLGRNFSAQETEPRSRVILLGHGFWLRHFGGRPEVVNQTVQLNGGASTIIGVMPDNFENEFGTSQTPADIYVPASFTNQRFDRQSRNYRVIGRLKDGVGLEQANSELSLIASRLEKQFPDTNAGWGVKVTSLLESVVGDVSPTLYTLLGAVGFMLLIACANVANLLLARATDREKEFSVRLALGAGRARIVQQLLSESVLLALIGGALGVIGAWWGLKLLVAFAPDSLPRAQYIALDAHALGFSFVLALITGVGFGLVPALQASRLDLNETMKDGGRSASGGSRSQRARGALIVAEMALALMLLVGSGLLIRSFSRLENVNPGFLPRDALAVTINLSNRRFGTDARKATFVSMVTEKIASLRGVDSVGVTNVLPFSGMENTPDFNIAGQPTTSSQRQTAFFLVTADYFKAMKIPLIRGRTFTEHDAAGSAPVAIINQSLAKKIFPDKDPIGQLISIDYGSPGPASFSEIVGVVGDVKNRALDEAATVQTYEPFAQHPQTYLSFIVRSSGSVVDLPTAIRSSIYSVDKTQAISNLQPLDDLIAASMGRQRFALFLFGIFSALALVLAAVGIYGVMAYSVSQRTYEIGIRMALGARPSDVIGLILLQGTRLVALGLAGGCLGALFLTRFISSLLFGISAQDPLTFVAIAGLLGAVATIACLVPALRALRVDPVVALRAG